VLDFEIQRFTRRCVVTGRDLKPGEEFYSVLSAQGNDVVRADFSPEGWQGPPDNAIGWWKSQVPDFKSGKVHWAPNEVLLGYFQQLDAHIDNPDMRYVLTLLMVRRRLLKLEEIQTQSDGTEVMIVYSPREENTYRVDVVTPTRERIEQIQKELSDLLFARTG
jgi:hypothetical protein